MLPSAAQEGLRARLRGRAEARGRPGPAARLLVLLNLLAGGSPGGAGGGQNREVSERLLRVSECSLPAPPPPAPPRPVPSSSEGSMESWWVQPGLVEPPLLWLRWWACSPRRLNRPRPRRLRRRRAAGDRPARGPGAGAGSPRARLGLSLRVRLSSSVVCRLPAELLRLASSDVSLPMALEETTKCGSHLVSPRPAPPAATPPQQHARTCSPPRNCLHGAASVPGLLLSATPPPSRASGWLSGVTAVASN